MNAPVSRLMRDFLGEADLDPLIDLMVAVAEHDKDGIEVSIDEIRFEWIDDEPGWVRNLRVWENERTFAGAVGTFHQIDDESSRVYIGLEIHPDSREPAFVDEVTRVACEMAERLVGGPASLRAATGANQHWKRTALERAGFELVRYFNRMSAAVDGPIALPELPAGFAIRALDPVTEVEEWVTAVNVGFAEHWDELPTTIEEKRHRMTEPGYMPDSDLVLLNEQREIVGVGFNARETLADGVEQGWVHTLALLPQYRGRGLGRTLLLHSMESLRTAGFGRVQLTVDSGNETGAPALYTSVGFQVDHQILVYTCDLEPAVIAG